jgi:tetratricopeptide (TPR) repeat protein
LTFRVGRSRARALAAFAVAVALGAPADARALGPARDDLPTVTDEPTPPPEGDEVRDDANLERAMQAFQRGSENYNQAKYDVALRDFLEAASLYASPDFQYNIGLCYEKLDKPEEAIAAFETYLKTKPEAPDRANVEDRIARLRAMAEQRKTGGDGGKPPADTGKKPKSTAARGILIAGDVLTGAGIVIAVAGGVGFGVAAKRKSDALKDVQSGGNPDDVTVDGARQLEQDGKRFEAIQIAMVAVGGALIVTGVALIAVGTVRRRNAQKAAASARFVPAFGARGAGLSLTGRF